MSQRQQTSTHSQSKTHKKKDQRSNHVQVTTSLVLQEATQGKPSSKTVDQKHIFSDPQDARQISKVRGQNLSPATLFPQIAFSEQQEREQSSYGNATDEGSTKGQQQPKDVQKTVRQLSQFNVVQRLSQSQANNGKNQWNNNQNFIAQKMPTNIDSLLSQQTHQHKAYISRQYQSIGGSTSNGSYVFNEGSTQRAGVENTPYVLIAGQGRSTPQSQLFERDRRSVTQESYSPGSISQGRNFVFKNVRNFNNLYENRALASKNTELQDKMRLGTKHLWTVKRADLFLPSIFSDSVSQTAQRNINTQILYPAEVASVHSSTEMIQIKRNPLENFQFHIQNELRQSPVEKSFLEKPGTHHAYQSTHYTGQFNSTDPAFRQNMTSNSFNQQDSGNDVSWRTNAMHTPFMPDLSASSNFHIEMHINHMKPLLRRNCLHNRSNIVIQWKSFEVWIARLEYSTASDQTHNKLVGRKMLHPVYVPCSELSQMMMLSPSQIELRIAKSLKLKAKDAQFLYAPLDIPIATCIEQTSPTFSRKHSHGSPNKGASKFAYMHEMSPNNSKGKSSELDQSFNSTGFIQTTTLEDKLPEEIWTSLYLQHANADHQIIIRPPCLEYTIPSKNFLFVKTLTREENSEFILNRFKDWQDQAISCLSRYAKFNELLAIIEKNIDYKQNLIKIEAEQNFQKPKDLLPETIRLKKANIQAAAAKRDQAASPSQMQIYLLEQASGKILDYNSLSEFKRKRFFENKSVGTRGFFSQNNSLGKIEIKPFAVLIKSLDSSFEYRHNFGVASGHWSKIIGFMQLKALKRPEDPHQLVDKVCKHFIKSLACAELNSLTPKFKATSVLNSKKQIQSPGSAKKQSAYPLLLKEEKINEKVNEIAQIVICEPSKTVHKLADLRKNGVAVIPDKSSDQDPKKQLIPQEQQKDSIEQQRKRFAQDSKQALRSFLSLQKRSKMLSVTDKKDPSTHIRYLVELEFPVCNVSFQGQNFCKPLSEEDLLHLVSTQFCRWKNYLMTKHFRLELNIGQEKPLHKIMEDKREEDDLISETDPRDKFPITEAEKPKIEQTRVQVTSWFPV